MAIYHVTQGLVRLYGLAFDFAHGYVLQEAVLALSLRPARLDASGHCSLGHPQLSCLKSPDPSRCGHELAFHGRRRSEYIPLASMCPTNAYLPLPVLATLQSVNKKPMDYESQDQPTHVNGAAPSDRAGPLNQALVHPAYRDYNMSSLDSTRNFSLPRERCLDPATPANTPAIPIPHAYVATGIISSDMSTRRPLPPLPVEPNDIPVPPSRLEEVNDMTVLPLRVQKRECAVIDTAVTPPVHGCDVKSEEKPKSMPGDHDKIPVQFTHISMAEQIITGVAADQYPKDIDHETAKSIEKSLPEGPEVELQAPQTPARLVAPAIFVQQPTPTTPKVIDYPSATLAETSTIRLVSPFLEIPAMTGRCPRRKK